jgi:hypothetical protein
MDYATGITGVKREISYKSLAEEVYVKPRRGVNNNNNSRDQVKRALIVLEKAGLIERQSIVTKDEKQLILKCLLAETDDSAQNKAAPWPPHSTALEAATVENKENTVKIDTSSDSEQKSRPRSRPTQILEAAPHPVSGIYIDDDDSAPVDNYKKLLAARGFYLNHLINGKTLEMFQAWIKDGITEDEAKQAMDRGDAQLGRRPNAPSYYRDIPYQIRQEYQNAKSKAEVNNHEKIQRNSRYTKAKSKTEMFYDSCLPGFIDYAYEQSKKS